MVLRGWAPIDQVMALDGDGLMWWFDTIGLAAQDIEKRRQKAFKDKKNGH